MTKQGLLQKLKYYETTNSHVRKSAISYINKLSKDISSLHKKTNELQSENTRLKAERDKAVEDLRHYPGITPCEYCKHFVKPGVISEYCKLFDRSCFEWRGLEESE